ncbi:MAG: hypothetical protein JXQ97_09240 [Natronospirillum sp.]
MNVCRVWLLGALCCALLFGAAQAQSNDAADTVELHLGGTDEAFAYSSLLLREALESEGYRVTITRVENVPMSRMEVMMERGDVSAHILGETPERNARYIPVRIGMTDNLVGKRVLFIKPDDQVRFDGVTSLDDMRQRSLVGGLGEAWGDVAIWTTNDLPLYTLSGDWKYLYGMVASGRRGVDYLPRGANEIALEWALFPDLAVEQHLVFEYEKDHILYVTPTDESLHALLHEVMARAEASGLIRQIAREFYQAVYEPPVSLGSRRVISLDLP